MQDGVYIKTEAGKSELSQRGKLPQRLRTLLVVIDGQQPASTFITAMAGLGVTQAAFAELERLGLIAALDRKRHDGLTPIPAIQVGDSPLDARERIRELSTFFNETIREALGLRGFTLQLKVERASTLEEFRSLRGPYLEAVRKSKGDLVADTFAGRLDTLLG